MTDEELLMYAYYYSFDKTGQVEIDRILSAIACAGKAFHHTEDWNDEATPRSSHEGATPIDWIQNRAKEAADTIEALRAENARLKELLNDGHSSMLKENEQLKWACAAKDADNTMMRSILKRLVMDARAAMGESDD